MSISRCSSSGSLQIPDLGMSFLRGSEKGLMRTLVAGSGAELCGLLRKASSVMLLDGCEDILKRSPEVDGVLAGDPSCGWVFARYWSTS